MKYIFGDGIEIVNVSLPVMEHSSKVWQSIICFFCKSNSTMIYGNELAICIWVTELIVVGICAP